MDSPFEQVLDIDLYLLVLREGSISLTEVFQTVKDKAEHGKSLTWALRTPLIELSPRAVRFEAQISSVLNETLKYDSLRLVRLELRDVEEKYGVEFVVLPSRIRASPPRIAAFDMDSTLIQAEVIDELARSVGKMDSVAAITEMAMNGQVDFAESLKLRVKLLKGVPLTIWDELKTRIEFMPGARELTRALSRLSIQMAVFSGGFQEMALWVGGELGLHRAAANKVRLLVFHLPLSCDHGYSLYFQLLSSGPNTEFPYPHLTGELDANVPIITAEKKQELLEAFAEENNVLLAQAICVGDGANDLKMLNRVGCSGGLAVAFNAKAKVQLEAPNRINSTSLKDLLFLLGKDQKEIDELTREDPTTIGNIGIQTSLMPGTDTT